MGRPTANVNAAMFQDKRQVALEKWKSAIDFTDSRMDPTGIDSAFWVRPAVSMHRPELS